ncbi:MAG: hypothetical protein ABEJ04_02650 [Halobacteriaceae archaeon]
MPECQYCGAAFEEESAYLDHLRTEHEGELSRIDRRRVESALGEGESSGADWALYAAVAAVVVGALAVGASVLGGAFAGGTGSPRRVAGPYDEWSVHYHGTIRVEMLGESLDFSRSRFQRRADCFHFENGRGERWHVHCKNVTLGWGLSTLGIDTDGRSLTYRGTTYRDDSPEYEVSVTVNGDPVDPWSYVLREGDRVRVTVSRE